MPIGRRLLDECERSAFSKCERGLQVFSVAVARQHVVEAVGRHSYACLVWLKAVPQYIETAVRIEAVAGGCRLLASRCAGLDDEPLMQAWARAQLGRHLVADREVGPSGRLGIREKLGNRPAVVADISGRVQSDVHHVSA